MADNNNAVGWFGVLGTLVMRVRMYTYVGIYICTHTLPLKLVVVAISVKARLDIRSSL